MSKSVGNRRVKLGEKSPDVEIGAIVKDPGNSIKNKTGGWRTFKPKVTDKCTGCGICVWYCPEGVIKTAEKGGKIEIEIDYDYCKGCGICANECPKKCIEMVEE